MDFEWDDAKAESNLAKHGIPFVEAIGVFADARIILVETARVEDGEQRQKAIGQIVGRLFTVVFTMRGGTCRIISARQANVSEERVYGQG